MAAPMYRRVIVKLSGEALTGPDALRHPSADRRRASPPTSSRRARSASTIGVVVGGGKSSAASQVAAKGVSRATADAMGMLATVMNALALEAALERAGVPARTMSALAMPPVCETYERQRGAAPSRRATAWSSSPAAPAIRSSPPTPPRCCAPPRWAATRCSRRPRSTASIPPIPKKDPTAKRYERLTHDEALDARPEGHGRDRVRACPRKPDSDHRVLDPRAGRDRRPCCAARGASTTVVG